MKKIKPKDLQDAIEQLEKLLKAREEKLLKDEQLVKAGKELPDSDMPEEITLDLSSFNLSDSGKDTEKTKALREQLDTLIVENGRVTQLVLSEADSPVSQALLPNTYLRHNPFLEVGGKDLAMSKVAEHLDIKSLGKLASSKSMFAEPMSKKAKVAKFLKDVAHGQQKEIKKLLNDPENLWLLKEFGDASTPGGKRYEGYTALQIAVSEGHWPMQKLLLGYFKSLKAGDKVAQSQQETLFAKDKNLALADTDMQQRLNEAFDAFNQAIQNAINTGEWDTERINELHAKIEEALTEDDKGVAKLWGYPMQKAYADYFKAFADFTNTDLDWDSRLGQFSHSFVWGNLREAQNKAPAFIAQLFCTDGLMFPNLLQEAHLSSAPVQDGFSESWYEDKVDLRTSFIKGAMLRGVLSPVRRAVALVRNAVFLDSRVSSNVSKTGTDSILEFKKPMPAEEQLVGPSSSSGSVPGGGK